jgi:opacity protein-like surface antigen
MKLVKTLSLTLLLITGLAQAQNKGYTSLEYYDEHNRATNADNIAGAIVVGIKTTDNWDYSLKASGSQTELGNGSISTAIETRIRKNFPKALGVLSPWVGIRLGESIKSSEHFSYYAAEGGVKFPLFGNFSGDVGYRYRDAFTHDSYKTDRVYGLVSYALTKQDSIAVRFSRSYGDEEKDVWRLNYTRSF